MGEKSEYSENVPSDLEFLGGHFNFMSRLALEGEEEGESPALGLVKKVLLQALSTRSWDLSVQPFEESTLVRGKNNGSWRELMRFPAALHKEFTIEVSRLWCGNSELYWGLPFDGLLLLGYPDGDWTDIFLSAVPGIHSFIFKFTFVRREKSFDLDLDKLGFNETGRRALKQAVDAPRGMVLVTGPGFQPALRCPADPRLPRIAEPEPEPGLLGAAGKPALPVLQGCGRGPGFTAGAERAAPGPPGVAADIQEGKRLRSMPGLGDSEADRHLRGPAHFPGHAAAAGSPGPCLRSCPPGAGGRAGQPARDRPENGAGWRDQLPGGGLRHAAALLRTALGIFTCWEELARIVNMMNMEKWRYE